MLRSVLAVVFSLALCAMMLPDTASAAAERLAEGTSLAAGPNVQNPAGPAVPEPSGLLAFAAGALVLRSRLRRR